MSEPARREYPYIACDPGVRGNDAELALLDDNGFVILRRKHYPSFPYGYFEIYGDDLPVIVSADMVLEAVHRSYDDILKEMELVGLRRAPG